MEVEIIAVNQANVMAMAEMRHVVVIVDLVEMEKEYVRRILTVNLDWSVDMETVMVMDLFSNQKTDVVNQEHVMEEKTKHVVGVGDLVVMEKDHVTNIHTVKRRRVLVVKKR